MLVAFASRSARLLATCIRPVHGSPFRIDALEKLQDQLDPDHLIKRFKEHEKDPIAWQNKIAALRKEDINNAAAEVDKYLQYWNSPKGQQEVLQKVVKLHSELFETSPNAPAPTAETIKADLSDHIGPEGKVSKQLHEIKKEMLAQLSVSAQHAVDLELKQFLTAQFHKVNPDVNDQMLERQLSELDTENADDVNTNFDHALAQSAKEHDWIKDAKWPLDSSVKKDDVHLPTAEDWRQHTIPKQQDLFEFAVGPGFAEFDFAAEFEKNRKETWEHYEAKLREIESILPPNPDRQRSIYRPEDY